MKTWEFKQGTLTAQIVEESPAEWRTGAGFAWETFRTWYRKHNFSKDANDAWKFTSVQRDVVYDGQPVRKSGQITALVPEFDWSDFIESLSHGMPGMKESMPRGLGHTAFFRYLITSKEQRRCSTVIFSCLMTEKALSPQMKAVQKKRVERCRGKRNSEPFCRASRK